ncbi:LVIVD repeat-containing protein [Actinospongicola halichondriae]|uniref:LVIVD repeat-containing protein n=1 Tax=Actinospongicola halichondriae TaxID=3236844 RepID=UPI003D47B7A7
MRRHDRQIGAMLGLISLCSVLLGVSAATAAPLAEPPLAATPQGGCGPGSNPETDLQGRVPAADHESGRAAEGYSCNAERVGTISDELPVGTEGGFKVHRYIDDDGHECAYYDSTLLLGTEALDLLQVDDPLDLVGVLDDLVNRKLGVHVVDMADPTQPVITTSLITPAMLSPHESLVVSQERGLIMATLGNPGFNLGQLDIYDISEDCRAPVFRSSTPSGLFGHESGLSPDGMTYYSASPATSTLVPVDISDPALPVMLPPFQINSHGLSVSATGDRAYIASLDGLDILDTSAVQAREANPTIEPISSLDWGTRSIPQNAIPITIDDHPYLVEIDEFGSGSKVGAGRIIDIADEENPFVLSNLRLAVHQKENFDAVAGDVGTQNPIQGYAGHYCSVPTPVDPKIVACSMIMSGLRVFSIVDPANPVEIAYYNAPSDNVPFVGGNYAMSAPAFAPERDEIWYSDGFTGFHVVRLTNGTYSGAAVPIETDPTTTAAPTSEVAAPTPTTGSASLPATGGRIPLGFVVVAAISGLGALVLARRSVSSTV